MALGRYPDVSLKEARKKRDEAREQLSGGQDPLAVRLQAKVEAELAARTTFRVVADEFIEKIEREAKAPATLKKARWFRDLLDPSIGHRPIADITAHELLQSLKRLERKVTMNRQSASAHSPGAFFVTLLPRCAPSTIRPTSCEAHSPRRRSSITPHCSIR